jgi:hypothetical protein
MQNKNNGSRVSVKNADESNN